MSDDVGKTKNEQELEKLQEKQHNYAVAGKSEDVSLIPLAHDVELVNGDVKTQNNRKFYDVLLKLQLEQISDQLDSLLDSINEKIKKYKDNELKLKRLQSAMETGDDLQIQAVLANDFGLDTQGMTSDQIRDQAYDAGNKLVNEQEKLKNDILNDVDKAQDMMNQLGPENSGAVQNKFDRVMEFRKNAAEDNPDQNFFKARAEANKQVRVEKNGMTILDENRKSMTEKTTIQNISFASSLDEKDPFAEKPFASAGSISDPFNDAATSDPFAEPEPTHENEITHEKQPQVINPMTNGL